MKIASRFLILIVFSVSIVGQTEEDRKAVNEAALNYVEAIYEVNPTKIELSVHPDLVKRGFFTENEKPSYHPHSMTYKQLLELSRTYNKNGSIPKGAIKEVVVYEVSDQTANAKVTAIWGFDYLQLAKYDGRWKIINILWQSPIKIRKTTP